MWYISLNMHFFKNFNFFKSSYKDPKIFAFSIFGLKGSLYPILCHIKAVQDDTSAKTVPIPLYFHLVVPLAAPDRDACWSWRCRTRTSSHTEIIIMPHQGGGAWIPWVSNIFVVVAFSPICA